MEVEVAKLDEVDAVVSRASLLSRVFTGVRASREASGGTAGSADQEDGERDQADHDDHHPQHGR